ncbi:cytoplasmic,Probable leucine--tRNA ligase [Trichinella spiralis]|uniref:Cytoplasmic,Probable leucine--tRNA ligase n=1 Tax=Trichinella spiralis TaxID=6334 RepID=A0ABR3KS21_TRISP
MLWLIVTLTIEAVNKNSLMETTYKIVYTAFLENQYGIKRIFSLFDHVVDYIQQSNKCCGLRKSLNKSQIIYQSYYTTLFWLESTNWGQMQQMEIQYNDLYHVPYVPHSCCINESAINCNLALLGDRYQWNEQMDKTWKKTIFIKNLAANIYLFIHLEELKMCE